MAGIAQHIHLNQRGANFRERNQSKRKYFIYVGNDERMSSRAETELFLDAKISNKYADVQNKKDALDVTNSEVDNHYVSVDDHKNQIKGYVALEAKSIVTVDDFKGNKGETDNSRKIIKPIKNYSFKVSENLEENQRSCFTANAKYDKNESNGRRGHSEPGLPGHFRRPRYKTQAGKNTALNKTHLSKNRQDLVDPESNQMMASSFDDDYSSYKLETKFFSKPQGVPDIRGYIMDEQNRRDIRRDTDLAKPISSKYRPYYRDRTNK